MAISTDAARPGNAAGTRECARRRRSGQAMVESLVVILVVCLMLFALLQVAQAFAYRETMRHAAARAARARTVGFNRWMCEKVMRVAAIPAAGKMLEPADLEGEVSPLAEAAAERRQGALWDWAVETPSASPRSEIEAARIPDYLASENGERAEALLDYEDWDSISSRGLGGGFGNDMFGEVLTVKTAKRQQLPIFVRMLNDWVGIKPGGSYGADEMTLRGDFRIESHYPLYLDDHGW